MKISKKLFCFLMVFIMESIVIKILQYIILPDKFFYDSNTILGVMNGSIIMGGSYKFTADFFNIINFFEITTLQSWSYLISAIYTILIVIYLIRKKEFSYLQYIFILIFNVLLNIYVFNLSKEALQFIFVCIIYIIYSNKKISNNVKMILISIVLLFEALNFRIYYGIMLMILWTIYILFYLYPKKKKSFWIILILSIAVFLCEIFFIKFVSKSSYNSIMDARYVVNFERMGSDDANTMIVDLLGKNTNYFTFIGNYIINFVRIQIPIELIFKGIKYIPFIIFQIFLTINLMLGIKYLNEDNKILFFIIISFIMMSAIFEPDFGSYIRHESTMFLLFVENLSIIERNRKLYVIT